MKKIILIAEELVTQVRKDEIVDSYSVTPLNLVRSISQLKMGGSFLIQTLSRFGITFETQLINTAKQLGRVYHDIMAYLPISIAVKIILYLPATNAARISRVSKRWHSIGRAQQLWKTFCYFRGWGVIFQYQKTIDWLSFYRSLFGLLFDNRRLVALKTASALEIFKYELAGSSSLKAHKKMNQFLRRFPDYLKLERPTPENRLSCAIHFELVNSIFNVLEHHFTHFLSFDENGESIDSEMFPNLRFNKVVLICQNADQMVIPNVKIHGLVLEKSASFRILNATISRQTKVIRERNVDGEVTMHVTTISGITEKDESIGKEISQAVPCIAYFTALCDLYRSLFAFHRGINMGKHVQFQCRLVSSLELLSEGLSNKIEHLVGRREFCTGDSLMNSAIICLADLHTSKTGNWKVFIARHFNLGKDYEAIDKVIPERPGYSALYDIPAVKKNISIVCNSKEDLFVYDPDFIAASAISSTLMLMKIVHKVVDVSSTMLLKEMMSLKSGETLLIIGKIWTGPIISELSLFLKSNRPRTLICLSSKALMKKISKSLRMIDWSCNSEMLNARLFDTLMETVRPKFYIECTELSF